MIVLIAKFVKLPLVQKYANEARDMADLGEGNIYAGRGGVAGNREELS